MADSQDNAPVVRNVPLVYFNATSAQATEYDLSLDLGYRSDPSEPQIAVRVVTTWEHAKRLHELLDRLIEDYEQRVGLIRAMPEPTQEVTDADD